MKATGIIFEIIDGMYKDKFFIALNKDQADHFKNQNKLVGTVYSDFYCVDKFQPNIILSISKLKQIGVND